MTLPAGLALLERIQAQMREVARCQYEAVPVPPFTLFFHTTDPLPYFNYAIPDGPGAASGSLTAPLNRLEAEFHARRRVPRFEFVEACAPRLDEALEAHGFALENRPQLMVCPRGKERAAPAVNGLDIATLDAAAVLHPPHDGLTELVGVSPLEAFRRRGIGGFLSSAAVRAAFERGVSLAFLSAADARAGRVYEAAGFSPAGHSLFYRRPEDPEPSLEIREATDAASLELARTLVLGHAAGLGDVPGVERVRADASALPGPYAPPAGVLLVATLAGNPAGCVAFKRLDGETCEVKRMFVDPAFRKRGIARALMLKLLERAKERGYRRVRLGTLHTMTAAQALYRDLGFVEIPRYRPNEHTDTMFFEKNLT